MKKIIILVSMLCLMVASVYAAAPTITSVVLNSTSGKYATNNDNLTWYPIGESEGDGDNITENIVLFNKSYNSESYSIYSSRWFLGNLNILTYPLDFNGDVKDYSHALDGTIQNDGVFEFVDGVIGKAVMMKRGSITSIPELSLNCSHAYNFWIRRDDPGTSTYKFVMLMYTSGSEGDQIKMHNNGIYSVRQNSTGKNSQSPERTLVEDQWYMYSLVSLNCTTSKVYIDSVLTDTIVKDYKVDGFLPTSRTFGDANSANYNNISLDEIQIFNTSLTQEQITQLYNFKFYDKKILSESDAGTTYIVQSQPIDYAEQGTAQNSSNLTVFKVGFNSTFDRGNGILNEQRGYWLNISSEPKVNGGSWFYFNLSNMENRSVEVQFKCACNFTVPVYSLDGGNSWERCNTTWFGSEGMLRFNVSSNRNDVLVAKDIPVTYKRATDLITKYAFLDYVNYTQWLSNESLNVTLFTVTNFSVPNENKKVIWVQAGIHHEEPAAFYTAMGLFELAVSNTEEARQIRNNYIFKYIPLVNPDATYFGWGNDINNPNRDWNLALFTRPEINGSYQAIKQWLEQGNRIDILLDYHGIIGEGNNYVYGDTGWHHLIKPSLISSEQYNKAIYVSDKIMRLSWIYGFKNFQSIENSTYYFNSVNFNISSITPEAQYYYNFTNISYMNETGKNDLRGIVAALSSYTTTFDKPSCTQDGIIVCMTLDNLDGVYNSSQATDLSSYNNNFYVVSGHYSSYLGYLNSSAYLQYLGAGIKKTHTQTIANNYTSMSFSWWFKQNQTQNNSLKTFFSKYDSSVSNRGYYIRGRYNDMTAIQVFISDNGIAVDDKSTSSGFLLSDNKWHHYDVIFDGTKHIMEFYRDGAFIQNITGFTSDFIYEAPLAEAVIGGSGSTSLKGILDEPIIRNVTMTSDEIVTQLYNYTNPNRPRITGISKGINSFNFTFNSTNNDSSFRCIGEGYVTFSNLKSKSNDIYNVSSGVVIAFDKITYTTTISSGQEIRVGDYDYLKNPIIFSDTLTTQERAVFFLFAFLLIGGGLFWIIQNPMSFASWIMIILGSTIALIAIRGML